MTLDCIKVRIQFYLSSVSALVQEVRGPLLFESLLVVQPRCDNTAGGVEGGGGCGGRGGGEASFGVLCRCCTALQLQPRGVAAHVDVKVVVEPLEAAGRLDEQSDKEQKKGLKSVVWGVQPPKRPRESGPLSGNAPAVRLPR